MPVVPLPTLDPSPDPNTQQPKPNGNGGVPSGGRVVALPPTTSDGTPIGRYTFESLKGLLKQADPSLDPKAYDDLSFVALAESMGDPNQVSPHGAEGLWQILPSAHGKGNWKDPLTAAKYAIQLYKQNGLKDWEESRLKGAGGGWGQFVDGNGQGHVVPLPDATTKPMPLPSGGMAALLKRGPATTQAGFGLPDLKPVQEKYNAALQGIGEANAGTLDFAHDVLSDLKDRYAGPLGYVGNAAEGFANVIGTSSRFGVGFLEAYNRLDPKGDNPLAAGPAIREALSAAYHPEDNDRIVDSLEQQYANYFHYNISGMDHSAWGKVAKMGLDIFVETALDPITYVPIADAVSIPMRVARIAAQNHVSLEAAKLAMGALSHLPGALPVLKTLKNAGTTSSNFMRATGNGIGQIFNAFFKDKRLELDQWFGEAGKRMYIATESAAHYAKDELGKQHKDLIEAGYQTIKKLGATGELAQTDLAQMFRYGDNAARRMALKAGYIPTVANKKFTQPLGYIKYDVNHVPQYDFAKNITGQSKAARSYVADPAAFATNLSGPERIAAAKRLNITPVELAQRRLELSREAVAREQTIQKMGGILRNNPTLIHGVPATASSVEDFLRKTVADAPGPIEGAMRAAATFIDKNPVGKTTRANVEKYVTKPYSAVAKAVQKLYTSGIKLNFAPHGVWNVGVIAAVRGGVMTAARGFGYGFALLAKPALEAPFVAASKLGSGVAGKIDYGHLQKLIDRNHANGGVGQSYGTDTLIHLPDLIKQIPGLGKALSIAGGGYKNYLKVMQHGLESFEAGYRASYLEHLDHVMGPSKTVEDEMKKGYEVLNAMGDYRNKTYAVKFFSALGGLFTNFRVSIAPQAVFNAIKHQGVLSHTAGMQTIPVVPLLQRIQHEMNKEGVAPPGYDLVQGGPISDTAGVFTPQYYENQNTIGPIPANTILGINEVMGKNPRPPSITNAIKAPFNAAGVPGMDPYDDQAPDIPMWLKTMLYIQGGYLKAQPGKAAYRFERRYQRESMEVPP
jgi:hypothetical protein